MTTIYVDSDLVPTGNGSEAVPVLKTPRPWRNKLNPLWWFGNDELSAQNNTFYYKYIRNPLQNFRWYVIGVADRPHYVTGRAGQNDIGPFIPNKRSDNRPPESGWQYSVCWAFWLPLLPFISYSSKNFTFYLGWEPNGGFGALVNFSNSDLKNA